MGDICKPSNSGIRDLDTVAFIRCVDVREPQIHEFWCHGIYGICREVHPYARIYITDGTVGEFVTE